MIKQRELGLRERALGEFEGETFCAGSVADYHHQQQKRSDVTNQVHEGLIPKMLSI